jgi:hypothetical protein
VEYFNLRWRAQAGGKEEVKSGCRRQL